MFSLPTGDSAIAWRNGQSELSGHALFPPPYFPLSFLCELKHVDKTSQWLHICITEHRSDHTPSRWWVCSCQKLQQVRVLPLDAVILWAMKSSHHYQKNSLDSWDVVGLNWILYSQGVFQWPPDTNVVSRCNSPKENSILSFLLPAVFLNASVCHRW